MNKSETISELSKALAKAQGEMQSAKKSSDNPFFKSKYADLHEVMDSIREPLSKYGLSISQLVQPDEERAIVETVLLHESGEWLSSTIILRPVKADPQGMGSAITYARRYSVSSIVGLASEKDDDANEASGKNEAPKYPPKPVKPTSDPDDSKGKRAKVITQLREVLKENYPEQAGIKFPDWNKPGKSPTVDELDAWLTELKEAA